MSGRSKEKNPEKGTKTKRQDKDAGKTEKASKQNSKEFQAESKEKGQTETSGKRGKRKLNDAEKEISSKPVKAKKTTVNSTNDVLQIEDEQLDYEDNLDMSQSSAKSNERLTRQTRSKSKDKGLSPREDEMSYEDESRDSNTNARPEVSSESDSSSSSSDSSTDSGSSSDSDEEVERSRAKSRKRKDKSSRIKHSKTKKKKSEFVTMSRTEFKSYMQEAIDNAMKSVQPKQTVGRDQSDGPSSSNQSQIPSKQDNIIGDLFQEMVENPNVGSLSDEIRELSVEAGSSETTIYSQLVKPPARGKQTVTFRSPTKDDEVIPRRESDESSQMEISDESNFNVSDEINDINIPIPEIYVPPPPPGMQRKEQPQGPKQPMDERERVKKRAEYLLKEAEANKAAMAKPPGKSLNLMAVSDIGGYDQNEGEMENLDGSLDHLHDTVAEHVDKATADKIVRGEYVEFHKLLPRDLDAPSEDDNLELTSKEGRTYYVSPLDKDTQTINSYRKWQIAFRVFQAIYVAAHPERALQLIQYHKMIDEMVSTWVWENVFNYDKRHRRLMNRFKKRFWNVPYPAAKGELKLTHTMARYNNIKRQGQPGDQSGGNGNTRRIACKNFNRGHCQFGVNCRFDHNRCAHCGKPGHLQGSCRKLKADRQSAPDKAEVKVEQNSK